MTDRTLGGYIRTSPAPDDMDGGVAAALIEKEAERPTAADFAKARFATRPDGKFAARVATGPHSELYPWRCSDIPGRADSAMAQDGFAPVRECPDPGEHEDREDDVTLLRHDLALMERRAEKAEEVADLRRSEIVRLSQDRNDWEGNALDAEDRAEKAEQERDEARKHLHDAEARIDELRAEQPRPLTPDDITELVKKTETRLGDAIRALFPDTAMSTYRIASAVVEALTVPTRPEGAEELERLIETSPWHLAGSCSAEADWLASRGVRVEGSGR